MACLSGCRHESSPITLFAAASTTNAVEEVVRLFEKAGGVPVSLSIAASSTLAKQIEHGAPASLFLSADPRWVQHLTKRGYLAKDASSELLTSELVLIAPKGRSEPMSLLGGPLPRSLRHGRVALGDPSHVPVGRYGRQALERLGWWPELVDRVIPALDTRAALAYVQRGECDWGIVYAVDARASQQVQIVGRFPPQSHSPIRYVLARVATEKRPASSRLFSFMAGPQARAVFERWGFTTLGRTNKWVQW